MIPKKSLDSVLDKSIILTKTAPNDNAKSVSVQCAPPPPLLITDVFYGRPLILKLKCIFIKAFTPLCASRPCASDLTGLTGAAGTIVIGYRGTFAFGKDGLSDVKFRKLTRILVHGKVSK